MEKARRMLDEEERMVRDYEDVYKEFAAERNQRLVDTTQQVHNFPHLRGGRGTPEPEEVARQRGDTLRLGPEPDEDVDHQTRRVRQLRQEYRLEREREAQGSDETNSTRVST
jgi:hypothetical protein